MYLLPKLQSTISLVNFFKDLDFNKDKKSSRGDSVGCSHLRAWINGSSVYEGTYLFSKSKNASFEVWRQVMIPNSPNVSSLDLIIELRSCTVLIYNIS